MGITTREEVQASLGSPTAIWEEENVWIYGWDQSKSGWFWAVSGGLSGGSAGYARNWREKICLLRFDDQGMLMDMKIGDRPELTDTGQYLTDWVRGERSRRPESLVEGRKKIPVLLRIVTNTDGQLDDEPDVKWFDSRLKGVAVRLGGFGTGGLIRERDVKRREKNAI